MVLEGVMNQKKPSTAQLEVLNRLSTWAYPLVRRPGGFWCLADDEKDNGTREWKRDEWSTSTQTVQALERNGWLQRTNRSAQSWSDPRVITEAGRAQVGAW